MKTPTALVQIVPNPVRCRRVDDPENVASLRRLDCQLYDACLSIAADAGWRGFQCTGCSAYLPQTPAQRLRDYEATLDMLAKTRLLAGLLEGDAAGIEDEDDDQDDEDTAGSSGRRLAPRRGFVASLDDTGGVPIAARA